jgi:hypothetical protein
MKSGFSQVWTYQKMSWWNEIKRKVFGEPFRPFIVHTRDYCFSQALHPSFERPKKLVTAFGVFYLHCGIAYFSFSRIDRNRLDRDLRIFNLACGMHLFQVSRK